VVADRTLRDEYQMSLLESEIATMKYVKFNTEIPIPDVYAYTLDNKNSLRTPYILMECVHGKPYPYPFEERGVMTNNEIIKVHSELTVVTAKLASLQFAKIGMLRWDTTKPDGVSVGSIVDRKGRAYRPFEDSRAFFKTRARIAYETEQDADVSEDHIKTVLLHRQAASHAADPRFLNGLFPLKHNDLHWQNVLFNAKCEVVGIIDWEWAHTVPVESFTLLPFNLASYVKPKCSHRHSTSKICLFNYFVRCCLIPQWSKRKGLGSGRLQQVWTVTIGQMHAKLMSAVSMTWWLHSCQTTHRLAQTVTAPDSCQPCRKRNLYLACSDELGTKAGVWVALYIDSGLLQRCPLVRAGSRFS
jgi:Phosphotransferase enzyme family